MPVMLINTSPRATHAQAALREVIKTMSGNIIEQACTTVPLLGSELAADGIVKDETISALLNAALDEFATAVRERGLNQSL
jgi:chromate reductase